MRYADGAPTRQYRQYWQMPSLDMQTPNVLALLGFLLLMPAYWYANRRLVQNAQRYGVIFDGMSEVMLVVDPDSGAVLEANPAAQRFYGYASAQMLRMNISEINTLPSDAIRAEMQRAKAQERGSFIFAHRLACGEVREVEVHSSPILHGRKTVLCSFVRDITERRKHEQSLVAAREASDAANRAKSEFLANMSHELRTPLNGVLGNTQLLEMMEPTDEQQAALSAINVSGHRLLSLINDVLDMSQLEAEKVVLEPTDFSLRKCLTEIAGTQHFRIAEKRLSFRLDIADDVPDALVGDERRIRQIVAGLLANAVKFTDEGNIVLCAALRGQERDAARIELSLSDTGIGIPQAFADDIFKPFVQVDNSATRRHGGSGLGLAISQRLARLMGGSISVESAEGIGSTFRVLLPLPLADIAVQNHLTGAAPGAATAAGTNQNERRRYA